MAPIAPSLHLPQTPQTPPGPAHPGDADPLPPLLLGLRGRRVLAAQLAARLAPAAWALGGYASAELVHVPPGLISRRPAVAVMMGEPPEDGRVTASPLLVIELAPCAAWEEWVGRGARAVWLLGDGGACAATPDGRVHQLQAASALELAGTGLRLEIPAARPAARPPARPPAPAVSPGARVVG